MFLDSSFYLAVATFAFITSVTPGPNNMMLLASGAHFGFVRTIPHILGIVLGMACLLTSVLAGLGTIFILWPPAHDILKVAGSVYLLWLAWKLGSAPTDEISAKDPNHRPMRWWQAVLFQYVNPKAWMMTIGCITSFSIAGDLYVQSGVWIIILFALMGGPAICLWAWGGMAIRRYLNNPKRRRVFNLLMGLATASTVLLIIK